MSLTLNLRQGITRNGEKTRETGFRQKIVDIRGNKIKGQKKNKEMEKGGGVFVT